MFDTPFPLDDVSRALRDTVRAFATAEIAPIAAAVDRDDAFPRALWPRLGALGVHGITVPEYEGGAGLGYLQHVIAAEEISRASASVGISYIAHSNLHVNQLRLNGTPAQKRRYLPGLLRGEDVGALATSEAGAGADVVGMKLLAELRGDLAKIGYARAEDSTEYENHLAALCDVMRGLIGEEAVSPEAADQQQEFFQHYLAPWYGKLFEKIDKSESADFYRKVARVADAFLTHESQYFELA